MNKNVVISIVLGALIIIAAFQAFSFYSLRSKLASGEISTSTATQSGSTGGSPQLPSNLQNLPGMVGGC